MLCTLGTFLVWASFTTVFHNKTVFSGGQRTRESNCVCPSMSIDTLIAE